MPYNNENLLIDHLDQTLQGNSLPEALELISNDKDAAAEWQYLNFALQAIQEAGVREQVAAVKLELKAEQGVQTHTAPAVVRTLYRNVLRVAASVILLAGAVAIYKYATVNSIGVYEKYYSPFDLNTSRGAGNTDELEQGYRNKNWTAVTSLFNSLKEKTNKSYFLAGMANLELKNYEAAVADLKQVIAENARTGDNYFQDQAEYYLAMAYLANKQAAQAMPILKKIKADQNHLYNKKVNEMSWVDLNIIEQKSDK